MTTSPVSTALPKGEIRSLTGLRGVAACLVMVHHLLGYQLGTSRLAVASVHLYLCVDLFFVLSGFVMALNYSQGFFSGVSPANFGKFLGRRLARIYPLYLFATSLCLLLALLGFIPLNGTGDLGFALLTNSFLITAWGFGPFIIAGPAWSISTEWGAYLLFPWLVRPLIFGRAIWPLLAALGCLIALNFLGSLPNSSFHENGRGGPLAIMATTTIGPLVRCLLDFTLGLIAWRVTRSSQATNILGRSFVAALMGCCIIGLLAGRTTDITIVFLCAGLIVALYANPNCLPSLLLGSRICYILGCIDN